MGGHKVNGNLGKWGTHPVSHRYLEDNEISKLLVYLMEANAYGKDYEEVSWLIVESPLHLYSVFRMVTIMVRPLTYVIKSG